MKNLNTFVALLASAAGLCAQQNLAAAGETVVNNHTLTAQERLAFMRIYGIAPFPGRFWYDSASGLWGAEGRAPTGMLFPGHQYGSLSPRASAGATGVYLNGREINQWEKLFYLDLFGSVIPGRYWLNGLTGMIGREGSPYPLVNLYAAYNQKYRPRGGATSKIGINGYVSTDGAGGAVINDGVNGPVWTPND
jgi:hypothetical protein